MNLCNALAEPERALEGSIRELQFGIEDFKVWVRGQLFQVIH